MEAVGALRVRKGVLRKLHRRDSPPPALETMTALAPFDADRRALMRARASGVVPVDSVQHEPASADATISRTTIKVSDAGGRFDGAAILRISRGSGFRAPVPRRGRALRREKSIRNVAYALLSGADGWMFDGEDALGQVDDDVARQPAQPEAGDPPRRRCVHDGRRAGCRRDERVGAAASSAAPIVQDWQTQLDFTTRIFRAARPAPRRSARRATTGGELLGVHRRHRAATS